jgi:hypothetical protein
VVRARSARTVTVRQNREKTLALQLVLHQRAPALLAREMLACFGLSLNEALQPSWST